MRSKKLIGMASGFAGLSLLIASASGCRTTTAQALPKELAGSDPQAQMDFWHTLPERKAVSNDEAFHALLLFADGQDPAAGFGDRVKLLREKDMLPGGFNGAAEAPALRGTLAVAMVRILGIKGGLTQTVFGVHPRYAVRELEYAGLYPQSSPQQTFSGSELMGIIGRAEDYQRGQAPIASAPGANGDVQGLSDSGLLTPAPPMNPTGAPVPR